MSYMLELGYVTTSGKEVIVTCEPHDGEPRLGEYDIRQTEHLDSEYARLGIVALIERVMLVGTRPPDLP